MAGRYRYDPPWGTARSLQSGFRWSQHVLLSKRAILTLTSCTEKLYQSKRSQNACHNIWILERVTTKSRLHTPLDIRRHLVITATQPVLGCLAPGRNFQGRHLSVKSLRQVSAWRWQLSHLCCG